MSAIRNAFLAVGACLALAACGGGGGGNGGGSTSTSSGSGGQTAQSSAPGSQGTSNNGNQDNPPAGATTVNNVLPIRVDTALAPAGGGYAPNLPVATVTVCVHGTTQCTTVSDVLVDTGSVGLRLTASALGALANVLPTQTDASGNVLGECYPFADGRYFWGPVASADIKLAGETATNVPMMIDGTPGGFPAAPGACGITLADTPSVIGANGILGVANLVQDCPSCTSNASNGIYYSCNMATGTCASTAVTATAQIQNPVALFPQDNNGVIVELPSISAAGQASVDGSLVFGIGTQTNNTFNATSVLGYDANQFISTRYNGQVLPESYIDSGSNGLYFPDSTLTQCAGGTGWYCPAATQALTATAFGNAGATTPVNLSFTVANENALASTHASAFSNLAGSGARATFDWGLPFFFGRHVYFAIANRTAPGGAAPYVAF
ncbi:DUF3443 family protein [Paraburkholderia sp. J76]|uniref:DUF3443 family protein n=1 Tax=Paraburkholderia sp. J76 TaxID=2805439 RepID=UPI002ABE677F|nr:DUF3443 family protein [Paraburkholderia sp. J76]